MICNYCGREIPDESRVCGYCGQKLDVPQMPLEEPNQETAQPSIDTPTENVDDSPAVSPQSSAEEATKETAQETLTDIESPSQTSSQADEKSDIAQTAEIPEGVTPPVDGGSVPPSPPAEPVVVPASPVAVKEKKKNSVVIPKMDKRIRPVRTAGFFWSEVLLLIPVVNLVLLFIWAFRRRSNLNRKAFARSILIWILIGIILLLAAFIGMLIAGIPIDINYWLVQFKELVASIPTY